MTRNGEERRQECRHPASFVDSITGRSGLGGVPGLPPAVDDMGGADDPRMVHHGPPAMSEGAICGGRDWEDRRIILCPTEKRRRRFYVWGAAWYSPIWTCLGCGDSWSDGERGYRPFARGWRQAAISRARQDYAAAGTRGIPLRRDWTPVL